jgi:hypothetical protein
LARKLNRGRRDRLSLARVDLYKDNSCCMARTHPMERDYWFQLVLSTNEIIVVLSLLFRSHVLYFQGFRFNLSSTLDHRPRCEVLPGNSLQAGSFSRICSIAETSLDFLTVGRIRISKYQQMIHSWFKMLLEGCGLGFDIGRGRWTDVGSETVKVACLFNPYPTNCRSRGMWRVRTVELLLVATYNIFCGR